MMFRNTKINQKIYRFAMFGRTASGKTCILAALSMSRYPNIHKYTCTRVPLETQAPVGDSSSWSIQDREASLHRGKQWLDESIQRITDHDVPPPNPNTEQRMIFEFEFTAPGRPAFRVELIDYAGELIDPDVSASDLSKRLRSILIEMDGILVLAEAPFPDNHTHIVAEEMRKLQEAFALVRGNTDREKPYNIPIALLINKWDRRGPLSHQDPEAERNELKEFLTTEPLPPHRMLLDQLMNTVREGYGQAFPVSAFGEHKIVKTDFGQKELPVQINPLKSFGLEDSFIWLAQKRDELDRLEFLDTTQSISQWLPNPFSIQKHLRAGKDLAHRYHEGTEERRQLDNRAKYLTVARRKRWASMTLLFLVSYLSIESGMDRYVYRKCMNIIKNPTSTDAQLDEQEKYLASYAQSHALSHFLSKFLFTPNEARATLLDLRSSRDERGWEPVKNSQDPEAKIANAKAYFSRFPNGKYSSEAQLLISEAEIALKKRKNDQDLAQIKLDFNAARNDSESIKKLMEGLKRLPLHPECESREQSDLRHQLYREMSSAYQALIQGKEWGKFKNEYNDLISKEFFKEASDILAQQQPVTDAEKEDYEQLVTQHEPRILELMDKKINSAMQDRNYESARKTIDEYGLWPEKVKTTEGKRRVSVFRGQITKAEDQFFYNEFMNYKDRNSLEKYLLQCPQGSMRYHVEKYKNYLDQMETVQSGKLVIQSIQWDKNYTGSFFNHTANKITIFIDGVKSLETEPSIKAQPGEKTDVNLECDLRGKPVDDKTIEIQILNDGWSYDVKSSCQIREKISRLDNRPFAIRGDSFENVAYLKLKDFPVETDLPGWSE